MSVKGIDWKRWASAFICCNSVLKIFFKCTCWILFQKKNIANEHMEYGFVVQK